MTHEPTIQISTVTLTPEEMAALETTPEKGGVVDGPTVAQDVKAPRHARMAALAELDEILAAAENEARNPQANADVTIARARALVADLIAGR